MKAASIILSSVLLTILFLFSQCNSINSDLSEQEFRNSGTENRAMALWTWMNGYVDTTMLVYEIEEMKDKGMGAPETFFLDNLCSWPDLDDEGVRHYSGSVIYSRTIKFDKETPGDNTVVFIGFEDVQEIARVSINGNDCGIIWTPPFMAEISIEVINTWNNRLVGDLRSADKDPFTSKILNISLTKMVPCFRPA